MDQELIGSVCEALEHFVELKKQNFMIQAWIQLKICTKDQAEKHKQSRKYAHLTKIQLKSGHSELIINKRGFQSSELSESPRLQYPKNQRMATDYGHKITNQAMFDTFNQQGHTKWQQLQHTEESRLRPGHQIGVTIQTNADLEDSDEFQDIVLDRLSKLQKSVNDMMKEKKVKDHMRGYVGAPIQHHRIESYSDDENLPRYVEPPSDRTEEERYPITADKVFEGQSQSWGSSPIGKKKQQEALYKLKYIPISQNKNEVVNINKIRRILDDKSRKTESVSSIHHKDEQDLIDNVGYFNTVNFKQKKKDVHHDPYSKLKSHFKTHEKKEPVTKQKPSAQLYLKYGYSNTTKNQVTPLQLFPKNMEMQSVIEPGARFARSPRNNMQALNYTTKNSQVKQTLPNSFFKARNSGDSSKSGYSYFSSPAWRANTTSLY